METLKKAEALLTRLESGVLVGLLGLMIFLSFTQVVLRHLGMGLLWADTFLRHIVLWVGFLGAAVAMSDGKHFTFDVLIQRLSDKWRVGLGVVGSLAGIVVCVLMAHASWNFMLDEKEAASVLFRLGETVVPAWIFSIILPVGFLLVGFHSLVRTIESAVGLWGGKK